MSEQMQSEDVDIFESDGNYDASEISEEEWAAEDEVSEELAKGTGEVNTLQDEESAAQQEITLVVGGQKQGFTAEEIMQLIEKTRVLEQKLEQTVQSPAARMLEKYAKQNGMEAEEYAGFLEREQNEQQMQKLVDSGVPMEVAMRLQALEQNAVNEEKRRNDLQNKETEMQGFRELVQQYPEVEKLPQEVIESIAQGVPPLFAYKAYENEHLKVQMAANVAAAKNLQIAPKSAASGGSTGEVDLFVSGFSR